MQKIIFIGQAPPLNQVERPFGRTLLYRWFKEARITDQEIEGQFAFGALLGYFPGRKGKSDLVPTPQQIAADRPRLKKLLEAVNPDIVVSVGKLSTSEALQRPVTNLTEVVGQIFEHDPYGLMGRPLPIIPLPHPSGVSTWVYKPENRHLLMQALGHIRSLMIL